MSASWLFNTLVSAVLLPPLNGLLLIALGWFVWHSRPRLARASVGLGLLLTFLFSLPIVGMWLTRPLEGDPLSPERLAEAQAIVILGGGRHRQVPEYGGDTVGATTLLRLRYGAYLYKQSRLPILVSGGKPDGGALSEAETMRRVLVEEFGVPVRWVEERSDDTRENALFSAELLRQAGIAHIVLVTSAWHMPRAQTAFAAAGLNVVPAPTDFASEPLTPRDFLPSYRGFRHAYRALHEYLGQVWYRLRS